MNGIIVSIYDHGSAADILGRMEASGNTGRFFFKIGWQERVLPGLLHFHVTSGSPLLLCQGALFGDDERVFFPVVHIATCNSILGILKLYTL